MSERKIEDPGFKFNIGDRVLITPLDCTGIVHGRCDRGHGCTDYRVVYWHSNTRHDEWLYANEIMYCPEPGG